METGLDLASRETLLAVITEQQGVITGQQGVITELRQRVESQDARQAGPEAGGSLERIRSSPVVHAGETGWRENGKNGYVWTFSTPAERFFLRRGRGGKVVDEVLGESFEGILVSGFYVACHHYPGLNQRCWAHQKRLELPEGVAVPRLTETPTTSRRRFCLACTLVG